MLYFKIIDLWPTRFKLHVLACDDVEQTTEFVNDKYEFLPNWHADDGLGGDWVSPMFHRDKKVIVCKFENLKDRSGFVHEIVHIKHRLAEITGLETHLHSQEWEAHFTEMIFEEICKPNYEKIKK